MTSVRAQQHRDRLAEARREGDQRAAARVCRALDDLYVAESFRRSEDRELRRLRRVVRLAEPSADDPPLRRAAEQVGQ